jgi:hypothetical protein
MNKLIDGQNAQIVQRIRDTVARLGTGRRAEYYLRQKEMFLIAPTIVVYTLYCIGYIMLMVFLASRLVPELDSKSASATMTMSTVGTTMVFFLVYPFLFRITAWFMEGVNVSWFF